MVPLIALSAVLILAMCALAYMLATYALPFLFAITVTRFAFATGAGYVGAGIVGIVAGAAAYGVLAYLYATLRSPILRLFISVIFAVPAAIAGYALVHGITGEAVPSEVWQQIFCIAGGAFVGLSAMARLADPSMFDAR
ncbi:hypothetical protein [Rhizobium sp. LC145]|uniref:hypothetical protein n=1 Tax=Rhizobium sp. LC145 TaxID=1120688 RepID=UPI00062A35C2|nr:hypothetical protein [Rhizobium sp. LC145]KKX29421.1 hypothetical protein YH62_16770 [Rhizobium sp. LC145]MDX3927959.1 hypothetical protein [Shinella sp.]TKT69038.1 hypothetical protein FDR95_01310 [Rhizobiaceae bacterium LC148]